MEQQGIERKARGIAPAAGIAGLVLVCLLAGCETTGGGGGGDEPARTERRTESRRPSEGRSGAERGSTSVSRDATIYKNLFDGFEFDALAEPRERLIRAGKPGIRFLVQFLLARSLARPTGDVDPDHVQRVDRLRRSAQRELLELGDPAIPYLAEVAVTAQVHFSRAASTTLGLMGNSGVDALAKAAGDAEDKRRKVIVEALGNSGSPRAVRHLERFLTRDRSWQVRGMAAKAIGPLAGDVRDDGVLVGLAEAARREEDMFVIQKIAEAVTIADRESGLRAALVCLERFLESDPPHLEHARATVAWMEGKTGQVLGLDPAAWRRVLR